MIFPCVCTSIRNTNFMANFTNNLTYAQEEDSRPYSSHVKFFLEHKISNFSGDSFFF